MFGRCCFAFVLAALIAGCTNRYFQPAGSGPLPPPQFRLAAWPDREYWWGLVFNGEKIGFSHLALASAADAPGLFEIRSESAFALRFLGFDKRIHLKAVDLVRENLELVRFRYDYSIDGNAMELVGERRGETLAVTVTHAGETLARSLGPGGPVYPQSAIMLYPALNGLAAGREYRFRVYSGELQTMTEVTQQIGDYEKSPLFEGNAFRVETQMEGHRVRTWIDARARPLLEIGMNGVLISGLEDERRARSYLAAASLNKAEALIGFALVRTEPPLARPRAITGMRIALSGATRSVPSDDLQRCAREGAETVCEVRAQAESSSALLVSGKAPARYLASTFTVPAANPAIGATARRIVGDAQDPREQVGLIVRWLAANVRKSPVDVFSALDVLEKREAECQGHAYLYTAFARSLGIPTRVVNGIVYSEEYDGFLYHTWVESLVEGRWLAVDPTLGTVPADATHVKLVEGEEPAELMPLVDWVGRLRLRVIAVERGG